jgi:uncharacterized protein YbjT (DUF2867 family)
VTMAGEPNAREAVVGATGYVGGMLVARLLRDGRPVRALARNADVLEQSPAFAVRPPALADVERARVDLLAPAGLEEALRGCEVAYYLVHSMERSDGGGFAARDRLAAENFVTAAQAAGVERVVYLGGPVPEAAPSSPHLASRLEVERLLLEGLPGSTALRASILVGPGSPSFRVLVRLVERLRVLPFPGWRRNRTRPIDERDAIEYLARTPRTPAARGRSLDIAGPDVLSYGEIVERIADLMGVRRVPLRFDVSLTSAASAVVSAVTEQPLELVRPLMFSLSHDLLPRNDDAQRIYGLRPRPFDRAVEHALRAWEEREPLAAR